MARHWITKQEMAEALTNSAAWDGRSADVLVKEYTWEELHDMFTALDEAEEDYYCSLYCPF